MKAALFSIGLKTRAWFLLGPFADHIDQFLKEQCSRGYGAKTCEGQIYSIIHFGEWLRRNGVTPGEVTVELIHSFKLGSKRYRKLGATGIKAILQMALGRPIGAEAVAQSSFETEVRDALELFASSYMRQMRGLEQVTIGRYMRLVGDFLRQSFPHTQKLALAQLTSGHISQFLLEYVKRSSPGESKLMVSALRAFLRHLLIIGTLTENLADAVPTVPNWKLQEVPRALTSDQVQRLLDACDRANPRGTRDFAVLLILARLGLRPGELVHLTLDDIDWDLGEINVRGSKGSGTHRLPLPEDVGQAITEYLRFGRPKCASRRLFLCAQAPYRALATSVTVAGIVRGAMRKAGIYHPKVGGHTLRHTVACQMLRRGANLYEIRHRQQSEILGEKNPDYEMEAKIFDHYAPTSNNPDQIRKTLSKKFKKGQTSRAVVNLDGSPFTAAEVRQQLLARPVRGMQEVITIRLGEVEHIYP